MELEKWKKLYERFLKLKRWPVHFDSRLDRSWNWVLTAQINQSPMRRYEEA